MDRDEASEAARTAWREFALACRIERDRLARVRMADEDRRFAAASPERATAELQAARLIAAASR